VRGGDAEHGRCLRGFGQRERSEVYCWGSVAGSGTPKSMNFPSGPNYVRATTGAMHACANFPNTAMMCIGLNNFGLAVAVNRVRPAVC